jgi:ribose 1,5-bisphosphokinase
MSTLFYIIGASGAGKDTLINYARNTINGAEQIVFAHRYITRPSNSGNENHIYLSKYEFQQREKANFFALNWESHGNFYGIGCELDTWRNSGFSVIVNGSREYLPTAQQKYPDLKVILIVADEQIITHRLENRGRESAAEIERRIARTAQISTDLVNCITIENNGSLAEAGDLFVNLICTTHAEGLNKHSLVTSGHSAS